MSVTGISETKLFGSAVYDVDGYLILHSGRPIPGDKYTWQHPGNKKWHCIDYVIMRQIQRCVCCDVTVLQSADCWTDHKLLRAQLRADIPVKKPRVATKNRFAVSTLQDERVCKSFQEKVCRNVENNWGHEKSGTEM